MNRIRIVAVGKIKEKYLTEGIREFVKRLGPLCKLEIIEIDEERMPDDPSPAEKDKTLAAEGERLLKKVPASTYLIVLDVVGQPLSSEELSKKIAALGTAGHGDITCTPGMGVVYRVKVPSGGWRAPTVSQEQGCPSRDGI